MKSCTMTPPTKTTEDLKNALKSHGGPCNWEGSSTCLTSGASVSYIVWTGVEGLTTVRGLSCPSSSVFLLKFSTHSNTGRVLAASGVKTHREATDVSSPSAR